MRVPWKRGRGDADARPEAQAKDGTAGGGQEERLDLAVIDRLCDANLEALGLLTAIKHDCKCDDDKRCAGMLAELCHTNAAALATLRSELAFYREVESL